MERPRPSTVAWTTIGAFVLSYDALCPQGEMLSERFDEWLDKPVTKKIAWVATIAVAGHLLNKLPENADVLHQASRLKNALIAVDDAMDVWND